MKKLLVIICVTVVCVGCRHHEPCPPPLFVKQVETWVPASAVDAVRYPSIYKAYPLGRLVDSEDRRIMHEAHVIYVRQSPDLWNLHPPPSAGVPTGPAVASTNAAYSPLPLADELRQELNTQKQSTKAVQDQAQRLGQAAEKLAPVAGQMLRHQADFEQRLNQSNERIRRLEEQLSHGSSNPPPSSSSTNQLPAFW